MSRRVLTSVVGLWNKDGMIKRYKRHKRPISLAMAPELLDRLEEWRLSQPVPPSKIATIELAIMEFLERRKS